MTAALRRRALVYGSSKGLHRDTALSIAECGVRVAIVARGSQAIALGPAPDGANLVLNGHRDAQALDGVAREVAALGAWALVKLADGPRRNPGDPASPGCAPGKGLLPTCS